MRAGTDVLITVRPIEAGDRGPLEMILRDTGVFSDTEITVALELIDAALGSPTQKDYIIRTAEVEEGEVAGYYCVGPTPMTAGTFDLYWIAASSAYRGMGVGKALLRHAEELIARMGATLIIAETSSKPSYDATNRFYLVNDYSEMARIRNYYAQGDDLVVYGKYFSQTDKG